MNRTKSIALFAGIFAIAMATYSLSGVSASPMIMASIPQTAEEVGMLGHVEYTVLDSSENVKAYLEHVFTVLKSNGILFGSTLGKIDVSIRKRRRRVFLMKKSELANALRETHFSKIKIQPVTTDFKTRLWFYAEKS